MKGLLQNALLLGVVVVACALLAEGALRIGLPEDTSGWRGVPALEDRVEDLPEAKQGQLRLLAIGDSFTEYRDHVGENWVRYAEERVRVSGRDVVAMNLGQMGTGPRHYLKNLRDFGEAARPDVVLVGLYLGNDLLDYELDLVKARAGHEPTPVITRGRRSAGLSGAVKRGSRLVTTVLDVVSAARGGGTFAPNLSHAKSLYQLSDDEVQRRLSRIAPEVRELAERDGINTWDLAFGVAAPDRYRRLLFLEGEDINQGLAAFLKDLEAIDQQSRVLGAKAVFLLIPIGPQVDPRYRAYFEKVGFTTSDEMAGDTPLVARLRAFFDEKGLAFVDPLPALKASPDELYLPMDTHWSVKAQRIAGEAVAEVLTERGLLER